jgi:hypothetical protein
MVAAGSFESRSLDKCKKPWKRPTLLGQVLWNSSRVVAGKEVSMSEQDASDFVGCWLTAILTLLLAPLHFAAATWFSFFLFGLAGGIETDGRMTHYGGIDYAWTNLAWLPGGLLLAAGDFLTAAGFVFLLVGSALTGLTTAAPLAGLLSWRRPRFGRWAWRLWLPLGMWFVWVPVPVKATLTFWHTVAY